MVGIGAAGVLFGLVKYFARGPPRTMTEEYQRATDEYLKVRFNNTRFHGVCVAEEMDLAERDTAIAGCYDVVGLANVFLCVQENRIEPITGISSDKTNYPGSKTFQMPTPDLFSGTPKKEE